MTPTELEAQLERLHGDSYGWALNCCGWDRSEAEDVLQTAYLRVVSGQARFGGRSAFKTWLFGVIRRTALESYRRARSHRQSALRLVRDDVQTPPEDVEARLERAESSRRLVAALGEVSEKQREVLHLVFYQDLSIAEAAQVMGVSLGSARTHYARGKDRLRALLTEDETGGRPATGS
ncbi:MAG: RNA polymerase sigma factor [Gemmatimonadota bacterium]